MTSHRLTSTRRRALLIAFCLTPEARALAEASDTEVDKTPVQEISATAPSTSMLRKQPSLATHRMVWNFGLNGARNFLRSDSGKPVLGSHGAVQFGAGYLAPNWYAFGTVDFLTGPFEPVTVGELDVDYVGTGFSMWSGYSPQRAGLRRGAPSYGLALGVSYSDLVGRSIGRGRPGPVTTTPDGQTTLDVGVESYLLEATNVSITPGLFVSFLERPRPSGNSPELLATRLEGHLITLGVALPILAEFTKKMTLLNGTYAVGSGAMRGYRIELTWTALISP